MLPKGDFTKDWFSRQTENWLKLLYFYHFQPLDYLEIGSYEGMSACWVAENFQHSNLLCVDNLQGGDEHSGEDFTGVTKRLRKNITQHNNIRFIEGDSAVVLKKLTEHFDVIYIDGSHKSADVLTDIVMAWQLLKAGGLMICDDYSWDQFKEKHMNPRLAIDSFLACFIGRYELKHMDYQVAIRKL